MAKITEKTYTRRDSATTILRKLGIEKGDYHEFIRPEDDGTFTLFIDDIGLAHRVPKSRVPAKPEPVLEVKTTLVPIKNGAKVTGVVLPKDTVISVPTNIAPKQQRGLSAQIRHLIKAGKTNAQIIQQLDLPDSKKHYPTWYRCEIVRKGL